jgi:glucose-1-phosphate adenylyltransferase
MPKILAMILAGGEGTRLYPLTKDRAKPAVPFGGKYRIIDFVLSNFVNSGIFKIKVLTQFKSESLDKHLSRGWRLSSMLDHFVEPVPAQMRLGKHWYKGSADAIYQNLNIIQDENPDYVCIFGGDHIYKMNVKQMLAFHIEKKASVTVASVCVSKELARDFGVIEVNDNSQIIGFQEKPENPVSYKGDANIALASMGNYIFKKEALVNALTRDAELQTSHDFGRDIITTMDGTKEIYAYDFNLNMIPGMEEKERGYWRDIGNLDAYYDANMDLISVSPVFNLYNEKWPILTYVPPNPPAKFVFAHEERKGFATDSLISDGCVISGGSVNKSILSPDVRINSFTKVDNSILFENVNVGRYAKIKNAIIDKDVKIPEHTTIGYNLEEDRKRFFVTKNGVIVIAKGTQF